MLNPTFLQETHGIQNCHCTWLATAAMIDHNDPTVANNMIDMSCDDCTRFDNMFIVKIPKSLRSMDSVNDTETLQDIIEKKDIGYSVKKITFGKGEKIDYIEYLLNMNKGIYICEMQQT